MSRHAVKPLGSIPKSLRLVDVLCPKGHLSGILIRNAGNPPALMVQGATGPAPMLVLKDDGLHGAMTGKDEQGNEVIMAMGTGRDGFPFMCPTCVADFPLPADRLVEAVSKSRPGISVARLTLGVS